MIKNIFPTKVRFDIRTVILFYFYVLTVTCICSWCYANAPIPKEKITAVSHSLAVPVIRGLPANPVLKLVVAIPAGTAVQQYRQLHCTINRWEHVAAIDVYLTGAEPFSTGNLIASLKPASSSFNIPVSLNLAPGVKFIWVSIVLKSDAPVGDKIELHCKKLVDRRGRELIVKEDGSAYSNDRKDGVLMMKEEGFGYQKRISVSVRKSGDDGVNTYRIPGIVQTGKGTLIAVYDIRYNNNRDLPANIDIGMSRSVDSGRSWQPMKVIMDMGGPADTSGIGDPSVLYDPVTRKLWVAALWAKGNHAIFGSIGGLSPDSTGQFILVSSDDDGISWSAPINITAQIKEPAWRIVLQGPGKGITMQNGRMVFPAQYWDANGMPYSTIVYSDDHGQTWKGKISGPRSNTTESQVVETAPGALMLNMRDNRGGYRGVATTTNMGGTWTEHASSYNALADPVCMGSIIKAKVNAHGRKMDVLFFSNPATASGRYNMTIKASLDMGQTWLPANQLLIDERICYGYSCLTQIDENTIGLLYEGVKDLYFIKVPVNEIVK